MNEARALLVPDFPMPVILDALRQDGYAAVSVQTDLIGEVLVLPGQWRVIPYGLNFKLEYWRPLHSSHGYWEHYSIMPSLIDCVRMAVQM